VYFFVVVPVSRLMARFLPEPPPPTPTRECPECLSKIPVKARRCAFCTAVVANGRDERLVQSAAVTSTT
jgi:large conductance mechanosensitive channel